MITPSIFKIRFPEFASINDTLVQMMLDEAYLLISDNKYQDTMVLYWTAHNLVIQQNQSSGNSSPSITIASEAVGNVNTSYANPTIDNTSVSFYMSTSYGQKYLEYKRALSIGNVRLVWLEVKRLKICFYHTKRT